MKIQKIFRSFLLFLFLSSSSLYAQQSFSGTDFWFAFMMNYPNGDAADPIEFVVDIISEFDTEATVSVPLAGWSTTVTINANTVNTVKVPWGVANHRNVSDAIRQRGVHVEADDDVIVYPGNMLRASSDAATAIPTPALGTEYHVICEGHSNATNWQSEFIIIGTEDNTSVTYNLSSLSKANNGFNVDKTIILNKGETFQVQSYEGVSTVPPTSHFNLTGSIINSDKPVAVYGGNVCGTPGTCQYCDHLFEQIRPLSTFGKEYYFAFTNKTSFTPDDLRVYAPYGGTNYIFNGVNFTLNAREFRDHPVVDGGYINSNQAIHVSQFLRGTACSTPPAPIDPLMLDVLPAEQYASQYLFATSSYSRFSSHLATVIIETGQEGTLELNGLPVVAGFNPILGTTYSYGYLNLAANTYYTIISNNGSKFGLYIYGYGTAESYGYVAGGTLIDLNGCPTADFAAFDYCFSSNDSAKFFDASVDPKYTITNFTWDFGDGSPLLNYNTQRTLVNHKYAAPGVYTVELTITNNSPTPCLDVLTKTIEVHPEVTFEAGSDLEFCANDTAVLDQGDAAIGGGTAPFTILWNANNGSFLDNSILQPGFHSDQSLSNLDVLITDDNGCEAIDALTIDWLPADVLTLIPSDPVCEGEQSYFTVSLLTAESYDIVISDGTISYPFSSKKDGDVLFVGPLPVTTSFTIESIILSSNLPACIDFSTDPMEVKVRPLPSIDLVQDMNFCAGSSVDITAELLGNAGPWNFEYTDGTLVFNQNNISNTSLVLTHNPIGTTTYTTRFVEYAVAPACRQLISESVTITESPIPTATLTGGDTICEGSSINLTITLTGQGPWEVDMVDDGNASSFVIAANQNPFTYSVTPTENTEYELLAVRMVNDPFCEMILTEKQTVAVNRHLMAGSNTMLDWCAESQINLLDNLTGSPDSLGVWVDVNGSGGVLDANTGDYNPSGVATGSYNFDYFQYNVVPCPTESARLTLNITANPTGSMSAPSEICEGDNALLTFNLSGSGPFDLMVLENGTPITPPITSASTGHTYAVTPSVTTTYKLVSITDNSPTGCVTAIDQDAIIIVNEAPKWEIIDSPCDSTDLFYKWKLKITGGDAATYYVAAGSTVNGTFTEETPGNWVFTSDWIPTGLKVTIIIKDAKGCTPISFVRKAKCDCKSDSGDLDVSPQTVCGNDSTWLIELRAPLIGAGDVMEYVLCDDVFNGAILGEKARNKTGYFHIDSNPGLVTGQLYHVVRIVGDDDGNGNVNQLDVCMSISQKVPVTFRPLPLAIFTTPAEVCAEDSINLNFYFTAGSPYFDVTYNSPSGMRSVRVTDTIGDFYDMQNTADLYNYTLISIEDVYGCTSKPNTTNQVKVNALPTASFIDDVNGFVCSNNNLVNLSFNLTGLPDYSITYTANAGVTTTLDSINNGAAALLFNPTVTTDYLITNVTDANGCSNEGLNTQIVVGSYPQVTLSIAQDTICLGDLAVLQGTINGGQPRYSVDYAWNTNNGSFSAGNASANWAFAPSAIGTFPISFTNFVDNSQTACAGNIANVILTVVETPTVQLTSPTLDVCEADSFTYMNVNFPTGVAPFTITYEENGNSVTLENLANPSSIKVNPNVGQNMYEIRSVSDANNKCVGPGYYVETVFKYTTPTMTTTSDKWICEGGYDDIILTATGDSAMVVDMSDGFGSTTVDLVPGVNYISTSILYETTTFTFSNLRYKTNDRCVTSDVQEVNYYVRPQATASISSNSVICDGQTLDLVFNVNISNTDFLVEYTDGDITFFVTKQNGDVIPVSPSETTTYKLLSVTYTTNPKCPATISTSSATVVVNPIPSADLIAPVGICLNDSALIEVKNIVGNGSFKIEITDNDSAVYQFNNIVDYAAIYHIPTGESATYWISRLIDNTLSSVDGKPCEADLSNLKVSTKVNSLPTGIFDITKNDICEGNGTDYSVIIEGGKSPFTLYYTIDNGTPIQVPGYTSGERNGLNPTGFGDQKYTLIKIVDSATPYGCRSLESLNSIDTLHIHPTPIVDFIGEDLEDCGPFFPKFINETDSSYYGPVTWFFGRQNSTNVSWSGSTNKFEAEGRYDIALMVRTVHGCHNTKEKRDFVRVYPKPVVDFSYQPNPINLSNTTVNFYNETTNGETYIWSIDTVTGPETLEIHTSTETDPTYKFDDEEEGDYNVRLESYSEHGCYSDFSKILHITGELLVNIPNSFTPNGDAVNDYFRPYLFGHGPGGYRFTVSDRWGDVKYREVLYPRENQDWPDYGWDGTDLSGNELPAGVYIYQLTVQNKYTKRFEEFSGNVNLLR
jgi:gliding motility-associated-like protein